MQNSQEWYRRRYLYLLIFACTAIFIVGSYLQRSSIETMLTFQGNDVAGPLPATFEFPKAFGVHYFSDFLWSYAYTKEGIPSGYGGTSLLMFLILRNVPYWIALTAFLMLSISLVLLHFRQELLEIERKKRNELILICVILTFPIIASIDRGQVQLLQTGLSLLSVGLLEKDNSKANRIGVLLLALAISIKGTPIFIVFWLLGSRRFKDAFWSIAVAVPIGLLPLTFFNGGIQGSIEFIRGNLEFLRTQGYVESNLAFNNGIKGLLQSISSLDVPLLGNAAKNLLSNYQTLVLVVAILLALMLILLPLQKVESYILIGAGSTLLIDLAGGYTLSMYLLPIGLFLTNQVNTEDKKQKIYGWCLCVLMVPKGIPVLFATSVFQRATPTYNSLINPLVGVLLIVIIGVSGTTQKFKRANARKVPTRTRI